MWVWDVSEQRSVDDRAGSIAVQVQAQRRESPSIVPKPSTACTPRIAPREKAQSQQALETRNDYEVEYRVQYAQMARTGCIHGRGRCVEPDDGTGPKLFRRVNEMAWTITDGRRWLLQKRAQLEHMARVATLGELSATLTHELKAAARRDPQQRVSRNSSLDEQSRFQEVHENVGRYLRGHRARRGNDRRAPRHAQARQHDGGIQQRRRQQLIRLVGAVHGDAVLQRVGVQLEMSPGVRRSRATASSFSRSS